MRDIGRFLVIAVLALVAVSVAQAGDLKAGWYVKIYSPGFWVDASYGWYLAAEGSFPDSPTGQFGPFLVTDGGARDHLELDVSVPASAFGVDQSQSLVLPVYVPLAIGRQIAFCSLDCETNCDPTQMRLEFWRTRTNGQQELVWFQTRGGVSYPPQVLNRAVIEGPFFFRIAIAPPEGFPDLSPPDITVASPTETRYYKHDNESVPISMMLRDYGTGISGVTLTLDGQPFVGQIDCTERPDNVLEIASDISMASLANGPHTLEVIAQDRANNRSSKSILFFSESLDAAVVGWGTYTRLARLGNQASLPPRLDSVAAVSAGGTHCMALKSDGTVVSWGNLDVGRSGVGALATPPGLAGVTAVNASGQSGLIPPCEYSVALRSDGAVVGWGYDDGGRATPPSGLANVTAISTGGHHSLALRSDATVVAWGRNWYGEATSPSGLDSVIAISAGSGHSMALNSDGTVVCWGDNRYGQRTTPRGLSNVIAIAAGDYHSLALRSDGTVMAWGYNFYGQATPPPGLTDVVAVSAGAYQSLALKSDGTVVGWGSNLNGEAVPPAGLTNVVAISAGYHYSLALRDITAPNIDIQAPISGEVFYSTGGPVPVDFVLKDDFDPDPTAALMLDGQPIPDSTIDAATLPLGDHILEVVAQDKFHNTSTKSILFKVVAEPMAFSVKDIQIDWRHDKGKPKADKLKLSGEFSLPGVWSTADLSKDAVVVLEIGGHSGTDAVLGKLKQRDEHWTYAHGKYEVPAGQNMDIRKLRIDWGRTPGKPNRFKLDGELDAGVFNDGSGTVTVSLLIPVIRGGELGGTETVNCRTHKYGWEYHRAGCGK